MTGFWISWWWKHEDGGFELHSPWWISGSRMSDDAESVCAAVQAESEEAAKALVLACFDKPPAELEWRFCEPKPPGWTPFGDRFQRDDWMKWEPVQ